MPNAVLSTSENKYQPFPQGVYSSVRLKNGIFDTAQDPRMVLNALRAYHDSPIQNRGWTREDQRVLRRGDSEGERQRISPDAPRWGERKRLFLAGEHVQWLGMRKI